LVEPSYRLRQGVRLIEAQGKCFLVSSFPLKAVAVSPRLAPLFRCLAAKPGTGLAELDRLQARPLGQRLETFLYQLVKKGFLDEEGLCRPSPRPLVSVIIPVRNRPEDIKTCLDSLLKLDYPRQKTEIIVVDDASIDETAQAAGRRPVRLIQNRERRGASACRNLGAAQAEGEILCFLDSDCLARVDWLDQIVSVFGDPLVGAAGGRVDSQDDKTGLDRYEQVKSSLLMGTTAKDSRNDDRFFYVPSCNLAVRRELFLRLGGFKEELEVGEDVDLCWRLLDQGSVIEYRPQARVAHRHRNQIWPFCRRRFEYGTSEPLLQALHPQRRKIFLVWPWALGFWALIAVAILAGLAPLTGLALAWLLVDASLRWRKVRRAGLDLAFGPVLAAALRSDLSFLYHLASFFSRYYLFLVFLLIPFLPLAAAVLAGVHLGVGLVQFFTFRPRLNPLAFLFYFSLEQLSYQAGVWYGCLRARFFSPISPKIRCRTAA